MTLNFFNRNSQPVATPELELIPLKPGLIVQHADGRTARIEFIPAASPYYGDTREYVFVYGESIPEFGFSFTDYWLVSEITVL
jgi:hypothetical protein